MELTLCGIINHVIWNGAVIWIIEEVEHGTGDDERR
jgi:hypothetical protein